MSALRNTFNRWAFKRLFASRDSPCLFAEKSLLIATNASERTIVKEDIRVREFKAGVAGFVPDPIRESERNCCRRNYASDAFSLFLWGETAAGTGRATGRCFINTPIVNCYHLIKSHFPRAFHDSANQAERGCFGNL